MNRTLLVLCAAALTGCGVELLTTTAIQSELQAEQLSAVRGQIQGAANTSGRINIERAIRTYQAEKGYYPPSLDALVPNWLPVLPVKSDGTAYGYDSTTGALLDGPAANMSPTAQDYQLLAQIKSAIQQYGAATQYYPGTLDQLAPNYLAAPPRTSAGEEFIYNNQNGYVAHPRAPQSAPRSPASGRRGIPAGGGGSSAMGEVMTGMGVQRELNRMGSSATNSAGGYARRNLRNTGNNRDQQVNKTMNDLGL